MSTTATRVVGARWLSSHATPNASPNGPEPTTDTADTAAPHDDASPAEKEQLRQRLYDQIIRVNQVRATIDSARTSLTETVPTRVQAGELGAQQIYAGQLFVMRGTADEPILQVPRRRLMHCVWPDGLV
jgi:demethoxyubiquinone hydroxylase (CLK1/Coq7/Cat5 family)